jgi:hypothetical protein
MNHVEAGLHLEKLAGHTTYAPVTTRRYVKLTGTRQA